MLVLSRMRNESIIINGNIEVVVVEVRGDKVKLGINAPKECPVHRKEVQEIINQERIANAVVIAQIGEDIPNVCRLANGLPASQASLPHYTGDSTRPCRCVIGQPSAALQ